MVRRNWGVTVLVVGLCCLWRSIATAEPDLRSLSQEVAGAGRVVATVTGLEGTVRVASVDVELLALDRNVTIARTITDSAGQVTFADVPAGRYMLNASRPGFAPTSSAPFDVRAGGVAQVLLDVQLTFVAPAVEVRAPTSPTQSVQPVSSSDMLSGSVLEIAPLQGMISELASSVAWRPARPGWTTARQRRPGYTRCAPISSTSLVDPSSGDFDLELPGQSLESVEMLTNPFAEHGRFSTSLTQIRTRRGTNAWEIKPGNVIPRLGKRLGHVRGFEPRFSVPDRSKETGCSWRKTSSSVTSTIR